MKYIIGSGFSTEMGMVFKNIEYMNGGVLKISAVRLHTSLRPPRVAFSSNNEAADDGSHGY
jgi:hypothetical protein